MKSNVGISKAVFGVMLAVCLGGCGSPADPSRDGSADASADRTDGDARDAGADVADASVDVADTDVGVVDTGGDVADTGVDVADTGVDVADAGADTGVDARGSDADAADASADVPDGGSTADVAASGDGPDARDAARELPSYPDASVLTCPADARIAPDAASQCTASGLIDLGALFGRALPPLDFNNRGDVVVSNEAPIYVWSLEKGCSIGVPPWVLMPPEPYAYAGGSVRMTERSSFVAKFHHDVYMPNETFCDGTCQYVAARDGKYENWAFGINNFNQIVGAYVGTPYLLHPFDAASATLRDIATATTQSLGGAGSYAVAINDSGQVVLNDQGVFLWEKGTKTPVGSLGGTAVGTGIGPYGQIIGYSTLVLGGPNHAFVWSAGTIRDLGTLGGMNSWAYAINASGQIAGESETASGDTHAFFWEAGVMTDIGTLGGKKSRLSTNDDVVDKGYGTTIRTARHTLNDAGQVVGTSDTAGGNSHAFLWKKGAALVDLGVLPGHTDSQAIGVNASGQVVVESASPHASPVLRTTALYAPGRCPH